MVSGLNEIEPGFETDQPFLTRIDQVFNFIKKFFLTLNLSRVYIGKSYAIMPATATVTIVLAMATLGDATQIGLFLFMSLHPRWPRQVQYM